MSLRHITILNRTRQKHVWLTYVLSIVSHLDSMDCMLAGVVSQPNLGSLSGLVSYFHRYDEDLVGPDKPPKGGMTSQSDYHQSLMTELPHCSLI